MNENDKISEFINQIMTYINADNKTENIKIVFKRELEKFYINAFTQGVLSVLADKVILITGKLLNYEYRDGAFTVAIESEFAEKELLRKYTGEDIKIISKVK